MERFWSKVEKGSDQDCWEWKACVSDTGYGSFRVSKGSLCNAHRLAWELTHGPVPDGMCVLHKCDNRKCVNPNHLFLGTKKDNTQDMMSKGRHRVNPQGYTGSRQWSSKLVEEDVARIKQIGRSMTQKNLGAMFGVEKSVISKILRGVAWKHVHP